ncbi:ligase-associated DNA damage response endonuclease PdeM [Algoriphagus sp. AK58]|uniref:ligase-associated DNA damage response endonuclease PdeM n=1 Tax=Algoriphagus sp. AK58 TaxID=1406877 RepID=UPI00164FF8AE|nr:ligase-associated DNA damage response endonuclease PdeM [Algoriphagus sp. AK58]MBC6366136.1 ligase-associated DNA damage response endonuclease PdeM [Algoriphagus sp. AK58]
MREVGNFKVNLKADFVDFNGFSLMLLPEKALWIKELNILLIADLHFGKAAHFRKSGIPIPEPVHETDFKRLEKLHQTIRPLHTYFLGDLFHSVWNEQWEVLNSFLLEFSETEFHLVMGNHDILPPSIYHQSVLKIHKEPLLIESFALSHEPLQPKTEGVLNICGHLHPGILLRGKARQSVRIPCFFWSGSTLILPSFGNFTGLALIEPKEDDLIWGISGEKVIPILSGTSIG